jgi:nucleotide-binding universal stress UspA family protein
MAREPMCIFAAEFKHVKHILIATDGSELAEKAVAHALALAKAVEARVTAVTVTDIYPTGAYSPIPMPSMIERYEAAAAENASKILASVSVAAGNWALPAKRCTSRIKCRRKALWLRPERRLAI